MLLDQLMRGTVSRGFYIFHDMFHPCCFSPTYNIIFVSEVFILILTIQTILLYPLNTYILTMPEICLTQTEYGFHNNQPIVHLFGRDSSGTTHRVDVVGFKPYFFVPASESPKVLPPAELDPNEYFSIRHEPLFKVFVPKPTDIKDAREKFSKHFEV